MQPFTTSQPAEELAARRAKLSGLLNRLLGELAWSVPKTLGKHAELLRQTSGSLAVKREQASPGDDTKPAAVQNDPGGCPAVDERCPASDDPSYCEDLEAGLLAPYPPDFVKAGCPSKVPVSSNSHMSLPPGSVRASNGLGDPGALSCEALQRGFRAHVAVATLLNTSDLRIPSQLVAAATWRPVHCGCRL